MNSKYEGANLLFGQFYPKNCIKLDREGAVGLTCPLFDPINESECKHRNGNNVVNLVCDPMVKNPTK